MPLITHSEVKEFFDYDPETGLFFWKKRRCNLMPGTRAGTPRDNQYVQIQFGERLYRAHHLAWLYVHGELPPKGFDVDHINGVRNDNRISNLRLATRSQNNFNYGLPSTNKTGFRGVSKCARSGLWFSCIKKNGKTKYLGRFETIELAAEAARKARQSVEPEFSR